MGIRILDFGFWINHTGAWILDFGSPVWTGAWILEETPWQILAYWLRRAERAHVLGQGATAYLPARADAGELLRLLAAVAETHGCRDDDARAQADAGAPARQGAAGGSSRITEREQTIIVMIAQGRCNKEVAHRLGISTQTVKNHVSRLLEKLALADRTQLAVYAIEHNFEF